MPRELRPRRKSHVRAEAAPNADLVPNLSAPAQTLASVATQGRDDAEERRVVGVVVGKGCLKRHVGGASGGGSGSSKNVSFVLEPQVRVMSPVADYTRGMRKGGETVPVPGADVGCQTSVEVGGGSAPVVGAHAPVRRSNRIAMNLGAGVEQLTAPAKAIAAAPAHTDLAPSNIVGSNAPKAEEEDEVEETVGKRRNKKRKTMDSSVHMVVNAQMGVPRRSTRSTGLLPAAPSVCSHVLEKRGLMKATYVKEQTCVEEQPAEDQDLGRTLNSELITVGTVSPTIVESKRSKVQKDELAAQKAAKEEISGRTTRASSMAAAMMSPIVVGYKRTRNTEDAHSDGEMPIKDAPLLGGLRSRAGQGNNGVVEENHFVKKLANRRGPSKPTTCINSHQELPSSIEEEYQEQSVAPFKAPPLRRSRRNHSAASELSSVHNAANDNMEDNVVKEDGHLELPMNGRAKDCACAEEQVAEVVVRKGRLKHPGADVSSGSSSAAKKVTRSPVVANKKRKRNVGNLGACDGVEKVAGAASRNTTSKTDVEDGDVEAVDRKRKASENAENIGYVWLIPNIATTNLGRFLSATKSVANKMATKIVANFGKKPSL